MCNSLLLFFFSIFCDVVPYICLAQRNHYSTYFYVLGFVLRNLLQHHWEKLILLRHLFQHLREDLFSFLVILREIFFQKLGKKLQLIYRMTIAMCLDVALAFLLSNLQSLGDFAFLKINQFQLPTEKGVHIV